METGLSHHAKFETMNDRETTKNKYMYNGDWTTKRIGCVTEHATTFSSAKQCHRSRSCIILHFIPDACILSALFRSFVDVVQFVQRISLRMDGQNWKLESLCTGHDWYIERMRSKANVRLKGLRCYASSGAIRSRCWLITSHSRAGGVFLHRICIWACKYSLFTWKREITRLFISVLAIDSPVFWDVRVRFNVNVIEIGCSSWHHTPFSVRWHIQYLA